MRARGCLFGVIGGSILRGFVKVISMIFKGIANVLVFTGLWIPAIYTLVGVILKLTGVLDPLAKDIINASLYRAGFWLSIFIAIIITLKNIFKPSKKRKKKREEINQKKSNEKRLKRQDGYESDDPKDITFDKPPAPYDNYPTKLSRKERKQIKKLSQQAKQEAKFSDETLAEPLDAQTPQGIDDAPVYIPTVQNGQVVYAPVKAVPIQKATPQTTTYNPGIQDSNQHIPYNKDVQAYNTQMPYYPESQIHNQNMPYNPNMQTPIQHMPYSPGMQKPNQNILCDENYNAKELGNESISSKKPNNADEAEPEIYLSKVEDDTLIHEFSDRFEVYKMIDGKAVKDRVEYKRDFN